MNKAELIAALEASATQSNLGGALIDLEDAIEAVKAQPEPTGKVVPLDALAKGLIRLADSDDSIGYQDAITDVIQLADKHKVPASVFLQGVPND